MLRLFAACMLLLVPMLHAQGKGVEGNWRTPGGAVIHVASCGRDICATLLQLEPDSPFHVDGKNPDSALRNRKLCGLQIGYDFHLSDPDHAVDGHLYDPKSGKTYKGMMTRDGDTLALRGYIGMKAFGRTEEWTRASDSISPCQ